MKKNVLMVLMAFSWRSCQVAEPDSLPLLVQDLNVLISELNELSDDFAEGRLLADTSEKAMNFLVLPFFNGFTGINSTNKRNPASLAAYEVAEYKSLFDTYAKVYGSTDELYDYYNFGRVFLVYINAVNSLMADLSKLGIKDAKKILARTLSQQVLDHASTYVAALSAYTDFSKTAQKGFKKPFSVSLADVYSEVTACAKKIISLKDQIPSSSSTSTKVQPVVATGPADSFIIKNFGDKNLSSLSSPADLKLLLSAFAKTYTTSDVFYPEYEMWVVYVPTRYWELQLLAGAEGAVNAFYAIYPTLFKSAYDAYLKNGELLKEPYKSQLASMALEFSITYAIARIEIQNVDTSSFA